MGSFGLSYSNGVLVITLFNAPTPAPTTVCVTILGSFFFPVVNGDTASLAINVHPSIADQLIDIKVSAKGFFSEMMNIGGYKSNQPIEAFAQADGTPMVAPFGPGSKGFLSTYWTNSAVQEEFATVDLATIIGLLTDTVFRVLIPYLTNQANPLIQMSAQELATVSDVTKNILPHISTTMDNAIQVDASGNVIGQDLHYAHYVASQEAAKSAVDNYVHDLMTIPGIMD
jgi:hypothetical protein